MSRLVLPDIGHLADPETEWQGCMSRVRPPLPTSAPGGRETARHSRRTIREVLDTEREGLQEEILATFNYK